MRFGSDACSSACTAACIAACAAVLLVGVGCKDLAGNPGLPAGTPNPNVYATANGAVGMRNAAMYEFEQAFTRYIITAGLITDELGDNFTIGNAGTPMQANGVTDGLDERILPEGAEGQNGGDTYVYLQKARGYANQALGALAAYDTAAKDTAAAKILRGELYAFEGYAELLLADFFCSGIPLSTLDFQGDFTYAAGSTTRQVYQDARAKFDTALMLGQVSDSVLHLAQIGKGRAYLALGLYAAAADDVVTVPDAFQYQVAIPIGKPGNGENSFNTLNTQATVSDREGINGLPYRSSGDPRTMAVGVGTQSGTGDSLYFPAKYSVALSGTGYASFTLASGIEARLIEAEAQLQPASAPSGLWLTTLNRLRQMAAIPGTPAPNPTALPPLSDPGTAVARIDTLFAERAAWLFVDGHRQGDLRRLLRQYGTLQHYAAFNDQSKVYPTGAYFAPGTGMYGSAVTVPIPEGDDQGSENTNPKFTGCKDRAP